MHNLGKMQETTNLGVDFWNDSCDPEHLREAVMQSAVGATSNPVIVFQNLTQKKEVWLPYLKQFIAENPTASEDDAAWYMIKTQAKRAAQELLPVFDRTNGKKGKLSVQVDPRFYNSAKKMVAHGLELADLAPNMMIKVPAIEAGIAAIEELTANGISINATVSFSVAQAVEAAEAVERGFEKARQSGKDTTNLTPCITLMVGRIEDHVKKCIDKNGVVVDPTAIPWSGPAVFKRTFGTFKAKNFRSKLLAAAYRHQLHWTELAGAGVVLSIPYAFWKKFDASSVEVRPKLEEEISPNVLSELRKVPDFRKLIGDEEFKQSDFIKLGASQDTLAQFLGGLDDLRRWVRLEMLA